MNRQRDDSFIYWTIWAFVVAFVVVIVATAIAAGREAIASKTLSAPSADLGRMMKADPVRLGVGAPGSGGPAVESIFSHDLAPGAPMGRLSRQNAPALDCNGSATAPFFSANRCRPTFPGVTGVFNGAGSLGARESDTRVAIPRQAAPGSLFTGRGHA